MVSFVCNICGRYNEVEKFATEPASCACGSNVRTRALIHLLSMELFDESITLPEFPTIKSIRGLGMSDKEGYAAILEQKFDYTNTFYERAPRFDFTEAHPQQYGAYDFILSADVLEHIAPPVERALDECFRLLKPTGFMGITVYCHPSDELREHFPELHTYRTVLLGDGMVLINRRADGALEIRDDVIFHGGTGETLEMREFGITSLKQKLLGVGFHDVHLILENIPSWGIFFDADVSQPLVARKETFAASRSALRELLNAWRTSDMTCESFRQQCANIRAENETLQAQNDALNQECTNVRAENEILRNRMDMAGHSRWIKLGRRFGVGPDFTPDKR